MRTAPRSIDDRAARRIAIVRRVGGSAAVPGRPARRRDAITRLRRRCVKGVRVYGPKATISYGLTAAGIRHVGRVVVYEMQREKVLKRGTPIPGVTLRVLAEADLTAYLRLQPDTPEEEVRARMHKGDRCIVAWRDGWVVGARWVSTAIADFPLGVSFPLRPGVAWAYDAFTVPQERRRGIGAMVTAALFDLASARGATHVVSGVLPENPSGQGLAHGRSRPLGIVSSRRVGPWLLVSSRVPPGYLGAPVPLGRPAPPAPAQS
jgi:GNAT superfamily N-acetyltransferase